MPVDKDSPNPVIRWFSRIKPALWERSDFEKVAYVMRFLADHVPRKRGKGFERDPFECCVGQCCDALADMIPEQREFWLRVGATEHITFVEGMTYMFEEYNEEQKDESDEDAST